MVVSVICFTRPTIPSVIARLWIDYQAYHQCHLLDRHQAYTDNLHHIYTQSLHLLTAAIQWVCRYFGISCQLHAVINVHVIRSIIYVLICSRRSFVKSSDIRESNRGYTRKSISICKYIHLICL